MEDAPERAEKGDEGPEGASGEGGTAGSGRALMFSVGQQGLWPRGSEEPQPGDRKEPVSF